MQLNIGKKQLDIIKLQLSNGKKLLNTINAIEYWKKIIE